MSLSRDVRIFNEGFWSASSDFRLDFWKDLLWLCDLRDCLNKLDELLCEHASSQSHCNGVLKRKPCCDNACCDMSFVLASWMRHSPFSFSLPQSAMDLVQSSATLLLYPLHLVEAYVRSYRNAEGDVNIIYPLTLFIAIGIFFVFKRYDIMQKRAVAFHWPPPAVCISLNP